MPTKLIVLEKDLLHKADGNRAGNISHQITCITVDLSNSVKQATHTPRFLCSQIPIYIILHCKPTAATWYKFATLFE